MHLGFVIAAPSAVRVPPPGGGGLSLFQGQAEETFSSVARGVFGVVLLDRFMGLAAPNCLSRYGNMGDGGWGLGNRINLEVKGVLRLDRR